MESPCHMEAGQVTGDNPHRARQCEVDACVHAVGGCAECEQMGGESDVHMEWMEGVSE